MDWIEQWFGFAPDGGDGTLELLVIMTLGASAGVALLWRIPRARTVALSFAAVLQRGLIGRHFWD